MENLTFAERFDLLLTGLVGDLKENFECADWHSSNSNFTDGLDDSNRLTLRFVHVVTVQPHESFNDVSKDVMNGTRDLSCPKLQESVVRLYESTII